MKREVSLCVVCFLLGIFAVRVYDHSSSSSTVTNESITSETKMTEESEPSLITLLPPLDFSEVEPKPDSNSGYLVPSYEYSNPVNATWRSRNEKVRALVKGPRTLPPSAYSFSFDSFTTLIDSQYTDNYVSSPFNVGGYNWSLIVYPSGNKKDGGNGYISLYIALDNSSFINNPNLEINANLEFLVYNRIEESYYTMRFGEAKKFSKEERVWGFSKLISLETFKDKKNGYLFYLDHCKFGVDVFVTEHSKKWEDFKLLELFVHPKGGWTVREFSKLKKKYYSTADYYIGDRTWYMNMYPGGTSIGEGNSVSLYVSLGSDEKLKPNEKIYAILYLRILDQLNSRHYEYKIERWYRHAAHSYGLPQFISFEELNDPARGFLVGDTVKFEVEFLAISNTKYYP